MSAINWGCDNFSSMFLFNCFDVLFDSIAKSLGAKTVCQGALDAVKSHPVISCTVSDNDTVTSLLQFLGEFYAAFLPLAVDCC